MIPAPNTSNCVFPLVRYNLLCLNPRTTQAGKSHVKQNFLWICRGATGRANGPKAPPHAADEYDYFRRSSWTLLNSRHWGW